MNKTKKITAILTLICLLFALVGCGGNDGGTTDNGGDSPKKIEYAKGTLTDTSFESEFIGLKYTVPEGCVMATSEEMDEMVDFGGEMVYSDTDKKILDYAKANTVYEMMASNISTGSNVMVMVEKLPLKNMKISQYAEELKKQLDSANMGYTYGEEKTETIVGQEYTVLPASVTSMGTTLTQEYSLRKVDNRVIVICITYIDPAQKEAVMAGFSEI